MATLVLTAVGTLVGGPIGGAIGSILGQQIDSSLFAPRGRQGPRLGNLAVQTSSYGTDIPKIFGSMRVAGTVIWATDLIESRSTSGGGKGQPKTTQYSYAANFAVALSGRPILGVRRIWADGKLLRGAAGDFKTATGFRLHLGSEDQAVDPLIASAEGANAPAFRGLAYAVFEGFQLADYGNRIPSLSFEIEADASGMTLGAIGRSLVAGLFEAGDGVSVAGYAASGDSIRSAIEPLVALSGVSLSPRPGGTLRLGAAPEPPLEIARDLQVAKPEFVRRAARAVPSELTIAYYDTTRDYQTGMHRATTGAPPAHHAQRQTLPAALSAAQAKGLAEQRLEAAQAGRLQATVAVGWRHAAIRPGDQVVWDDMRGPWRIGRWTLRRGTLQLEVQRVAGASMAELPPAEPGSGAVQPDVAHGPTTLRVMDLPLGDDSGARPRLFVAAAGIAPGWRRANLLVSYDGGASWADEGSTAPATVMGRALNALGASPEALFDLTGSVEVELLNGDMWLQGASDIALSGGANLAVLGRELIQFGEAAHLGGRRFRLSRLLRGRRGTDAAISSHAEGEDFVLLERDTLRVAQAFEGSIGTIARFSASGVGDETPAVATCLVEGSGLRPPAPVHLRATRDSDGDLVINWTRRSRLGWAWGDGDAPLGEEREDYLATITGAGGQRTIASVEPHHVHSFAQQLADGLSGPLTIEVVQVGTHGRSLPAVISIV